MSTPRSESVSQARQDDPFASGASTEARFNNDRVGHYAALAKVIHETMRQYVTNDDNAALLYASPSAKALRWHYVDSLVAQAHAVLHSDAFASIHQGLQRSQSERSPSHWQLVEESLEAGAHTFANTTESLYDALAAEFSPEVTESPDNFVILDRLAKLGINQFIAYRDVYLGTAANRRAFTSHLQPEKTGMGFKPRYPLDAKVPTVLALTHDLRGADDFVLQDAPVIRLKDFPDADQTIGCPITFYGGQVKELWTLYAEGRRSLRRRQEFGAGVARIGNPLLATDGSGAS